MITTYKNAKNETVELSKMKDCFKNVFVQLNERAIQAGYKELEIEVYKDSVADPRYAFQSKGMMFRFKFEKAGQKTFWEHWSFNAPAFKRGSLSGKPIRLQIPTTTENDEWLCKYEFI
jgi:hypothetical protein